jgi:lysophospholipase L1-like esterase
MKKTLKIVAVIVGLLALAAAWPAWYLYQEIDKARSEDPLVWEADVVALERKTLDSCSAGQGVVFLGSSSIRLWDTLVADMAPLTVVQHGFGGAKLNDLVHYATRLVNACRPRAVVVFAGTNDIDPAASKTPQVLLASYQALIAKIRAARPELPVFYIGITPSPLRWSVWPIAQATNQAIAQWSAQQKNLFFIDTSAALMGSTGEPDDDNYRFDGLHLSARGYRIWAGIIRAQLVRELDALAAHPASREPPQTLPVSAGDN